MQTATSTYANKSWYKTFKQLAWTDILLPFTIIISIIIGLVIGEYVPSATDAFDSNKHASLVGVSIPLAIGMIIMMLPPLTRVEWESLPRYIAKPNIARQILWSLLLNWIVCPFLMFGLAWMVLFKQPEYREGIIMIGTARCIAMVITWNIIAGGDLMLCVTLVIINSLLQMILYAPYVIFFGYVITGESYDSGAMLYKEVAKSVGVFLGIPLAAGFLIRFTTFLLIGKERFLKWVVPFINPWGMIAFHYTIIVIFIGNGHEFLHHIGSAFLCFIPLTLYFLIAWFGCFFLMRYITSRKQAKLDEADEANIECDCEKEALIRNKNLGKATCGANFAITMTQCFTAASNNFELSLAVAVSMYGNGSRQAIAATFGPLLEVPILLILAIVAKYFEHLFMWSHTTVEVLEDEEETDDTLDENYSAIH
ncbi:arsenical-resistance protein 3 [Monosporozyma servazzii]